MIGGQLGVNWQWNWFVLGAEGDASWSGIDLEDEFDDNDDDDDDDDEAGIDWLASARLRAGVGLDRVLIYGTGGVGFAGFDEGDGFGGNGGGGGGSGRGGNGGGGNNSDDDDDDDTEVGWVAGGGAEFMITDNVTIGAEYLHYDFDDDDDDDNGGNRNRGGGGRSGGDDNMGLDDIDVVRGRVNVKFGSLFGGG
ncbi:MAG: outer membrane beta-barrel protein [Pseudomonadota bacterium]|nr:outer membrane beta-barrel protein [Pseudomonadota bacterium]